MKGPKDFEKPLSPEQLAQVEKLERQVEEGFERGQETYQVNTMETLASHSFDVWQELVDRAARTGWNARLQGAMVIITRPLRGRIR